MNCRKTRSLLSAYIDRELTGFEMLAIRDHLSGCTGCDAEHRSLVSVKTLLGALMEHAPREEFLVRVQTASQVATPLGALQGMFIRQAGSKQRSTFGAHAFLSLTLPESSRRAASVCVLGLLGVWVAVTPPNTTTDLGAGTLVSSAMEAKANRLLDLAGFPSPGSLVQWHPAMANAPAYDKMDRPVELQDASSSLSQSGDDQNNPITLLNLPSYQASVPQPMTVQGQPASDIVYTGYSVASR